MRWGLGSAATREVPTRQCSVGGRDIKRTFFSSLKIDCPILLPQPAPARPATESDRPAFQRKHVLGTGRYSASTGAGKRSQCVLAQPPLRRQLGDEGIVDASAI